MGSSLRPVLRNQVHRERNEDGIHVSGETQQRCMLYGVHKYWEDQAGTSQVTEWVGQRLLNGWMVALHVQANMAS
jgi:hypothetical protein